MKNDTLTIYMKDGKTFVFGTNDYTDYRYVKSIFVVIKNDQWVGIFNMSEVACVIYNEN